MVETLVLGIKALQLSANMAAIDRIPEEDEGIPTWVMASTLAVSLVFGIGLFFVAPLLIAWALGPVLNSDLLSEIVEGVIRLVFLVYHHSSPALSSIRSTSEKPPSCWPQC